MSKFSQRLQDKETFNILVEFTCPAGQPPRKLLSFLAAYEEDRPTWDGLDITAVTVTQNPSGVVTASPTDVIAHVKLAGGLHGLDYVPHVSAKGMNQAEVETVLKGLLSYGVEDCFVITGDKPATGMPVFELDSINVLQMIQRMNSDAILDAGPGGEAGTLWPGAAVGLAKYEEASCLQQHFKLEKKVRLGGAGFVITNLIFDSRKVRDLFRYLSESGLEVPIIGNVFFLHEPAARRMKDERLPGVYISPDLYRKVAQESYEEHLLRAAQQVAMWRDLGAAGVDLGNLEDLGLVKEIIDLAVEIGPEWTKADDNVSFPPPSNDLFYLYTPDGKASPLREARVPLRRKVLKGVHNLFFEEGATGYAGVKSLMGHSKGIRDAEGVLYSSVQLMEHLGKGALAKCQSCGDCFLPENYYVCVMGECSKGLPNVPCGDSTVDGRCGVDSTKPCAGVLIYDAARYFGEDIGVLRGRVNPPKDPGLTHTSSFRSFFLGLDHRKSAPLIQVAELLHSTIPSVKRALEIINSTENGFQVENAGLTYLRNVVKAQALRNPDYIDANVDDAGEGDSERASFLIRQLVRLICEEGRGIPPCIDSSDPEVIRAGLEEFYRLKDIAAPRPLINSANRERREFVWDLQEVGSFNIVYMLMGGTPGGVTSADELVEDALGFFREARKHGFDAEQVYFDTTVIPLAMEFSRYQEPGFSYVSMETLHRVMHNDEMKGVNSILGITNLTRDFPAGRKIGLLRAYVQIAMEAGLTAAIVDVRREFGIRPPDDQEILDIVRAFVEQDGSSEAYDRMMAAYETYKSYGMKKRA